MSDLSNEKIDAITIRFKKQQTSKIRRAAKLADMSFAKFVRNHCEAAADAVLANPDKKKLAAPGARL